MEPDDGYCQVVVRKAMEDPQPCGLETPCPTHSEPAPNRRSLRERGYANANEYTGIYLGDRRDV